MKTLCPALLGFLVFTGFADARMADFYGKVLVTSPDGFVRPVDTTSAGQPVKQIQIEGTGGMSWSADEAWMILESAGSAGAEILRLGTWTLASGILDVQTDTGRTVDVKVDRATVRIQGHAVISNVPDVECSIRVYEGQASVRNGTRPVSLSAMDSLRISKGGRVGVGDAASAGVSDAGQTRAALFPPPYLASLPPYVTLPLSLTLQAADGANPRTEAEAVAVAVEYTAHKNFWSNAGRYIFRPDEQVILTDLPAGTLYIRARTVNRSGLEGPAGPAIRVIVLRETPRVAVQRTATLQTEILRGQLDRPIENAAIIWDHIRTTTDMEGGFEFHPDQPFGLTVADLKLNSPGLSFVLDPLLYLSDPDKLTYVPEAVDGSPPVIFMRTSTLPFKNTSQDIKVFLDGVLLRTADTLIPVPPHTSRTLRFERLDEELLSASLPPMVSIFQDVEGPRILNVGLETRGSSERFYVLADVLDLGIGLRLPARAVFENDAGERLEIPLRRVSDIRLEGSAMAASLQDAPKVRSRVWWVQVVADDLLGNSSRYEKAVFHKRQKKFLSVGLKDLIKIWKNKL